MIAKLHSTLPTPKLIWTKTQEKSLSCDFPFELEQETDEQYVFRTYLQFLWLPESIMPLNLMIPSFLRINPQLASNHEVHPLHTLLKPLLHTARSASDKYHVELPQILTDGGGAGEIEETMMWYALNHEQADDELWTRTNATGQGPWIDEKWRTKWIERMERREFQIQILLYFLKLSLSGPPPPQESPRKKQKRSRLGPPPKTLSEEEHLEAFMDKLSMWQLVAGLENTDMKGKSRNDEHDWMQRFFEEIVAPQFEEKLPELCSLFRSKIFPYSPFSSSSAQTSPASSRAPSPDISLHDKHLTGESSARHSSPALSATSSASRPLARSRSLSVSLALEREREKGAGAAPTKKRSLNREISMSRVFKPKQKASDGKKRGPTQESQTKPQKIDEGVTLVAATPVKKLKGMSRSKSQITFGEETQSPVPGFSLSQSQGENDDDEIWDPPSSPDALLLKGSTQGRDLRQMSPIDDSLQRKRPRLN